jgi:hypothetical protein
MQRLFSVLAVTALIALVPSTAAFAVDEEKTAKPEQAAEPADASAAAIPGPPARAWLGGRGSGICPWAAPGWDRGPATGCPWWAVGRGGQGFGRGAGYGGGRGWGARQGGGFELGRNFVDQNGDGICDHRQTLPEAAP